LGKLISECKKKRKKKLNISSKIHIAYLLGWFTRCNLPSNSIICQEIFLCEYINIRLNTTTFIFIH